MKNKKQITFLSVLLASTMLLAACNPAKPSSESSSVDPNSASSSEPEVVKHKATFVANGQTVQEVDVEEGGFAEFTAAEPTKAADANAVKYGFRGWDKDPATTAINADTTFTAQFQPYAAEVVIDDFESYSTSSAMIDANWVAIGWKNNAWSEETNAAVSLGSKAAGGAKALRFDAWQNDSWYKIAKKFPTNTFDKAVNALKFSLMVPRNAQIQVILYAQATIEGQQQTPAFYYPITAASGEYVEYTIPLNDSAWDLWNQHENKSIASVANWTGIHQDDIMSYLTKIEISIKGKVDNNLKYVGFLDSMRFVTIDNPAKGEVETMGQYNRYTGLLADGSTVRIDIGANGAATATVLDAAEQQRQVPGTVAINGKEMTFTSGDQGATLVYKGKLVNGGQQVEYVSATGTLANAVANMNLNSVQVVDNFEQYTADGKAYYQSNTDISKRSGCRGAYYSEYYAGGTNSSPWGGNGWALLGGDGDQLKLKSDNGGHNGSKNYLCLKHTSGAAFRYMQWGLFDGTSEQQAFRGSKFSFWAKTNGKVNNFKVYMYSQTSPTNATKDEDVRSFAFTETAAISEWKHYEIDLNPNINYYGYMIFMEKDTSLSAATYLYVDDVEVYSANPYATYVAPASLAKGLTFVSNINGLFNVKIEVGDNKAVSLKAPGLGMTVPGTYAVDKQDIEMTFGQTKYVATLSKDGQSLTFKSVTGTDTIAQYLNNMSFKMIEYADNAETYESDGQMYYIGNKNVDNRSGARGAYHCDYYKSGTTDKSIIGGNDWSLMGGSGDQLQLDKTNAFDGSQSLKMKYSTAGGMRYLQWGLADGTGVAHKGFNRLGVYIKNPNANAVSIKLYAYHVQTVTPSTQGDSSRASVQLSIPANSDWSFYSLTLDASKTYYGYGIYMVTTSSTGYINVDAAHYYNEGANPYQNFLAKKDVSLSGTTNAGAATIKFGDSGKVLLTCTGLNADNAECAYKMYMNGNAQEMVITVGNDTIKGTYAVNAQGVATFKVIEATGNLAAAIAANTVFANAN